MFTMVLLGLGDMEEARSAVQVAAGLAARHGAGLFVQHVSPPKSRDGACVLELPTQSELEARRAEVEELCRRHLPPGLTADVAAGAGFLHVELLKMARLAGPDLLVLGGSDALEQCRRELDADGPGASGGEAALLLAQSAPCPVLAVPREAGRPGPFERMLVVADADKADRPLLELAARLAAREGAELSVLQPLPLPLGSAAPAQDEAARKVQAAKERLAYLCQGLPGSERFRLDAAEGEPGVEIFKHARERQADLLLLAVDHPTAAHVLRNARIPVLLRKSATQGA